jgi:hypothetical protein
MKTQNKKKRFQDAINSVKEQKSIPRFRNHSNAINWLITQHSKVYDLPINLLDGSDRTEIICHCIISSQLLYNKTKDHFWKEVTNKLKSNYERGFY